MSWTPNEGSAELWLERANLAGAYLELALYGVHFAVFCVAARTLWANKLRLQQTCGVLLGYISLVFVISSIGNIARGRRVEEALIDNRNYTGGPAAYLLSPPLSAASLNALDVATFSVNTWLANGYLLHRLGVLWNERRWLCIVPFLTFLLSIVSSCLYINEVSRNAVLWQRVFGHADFALMFWSTTAATSIYLTIGIIAKIQYMRRQLHKVRGGECYSPFLSTTAAVVESGLLSTIFQICMLAAYARDNTVNLIFLGVTVQTNSIAMLFIVLRVAQDSAWSISKGRGMMHDAVSHDAISLNLRGGSVRRPFSNSTITSVTDTKIPSDADAVYSPRPQAAVRGGQFAVLRDYV